MILSKYTELEFSTFKLKKKNSVKTRSTTNVSPSFSTCYALTHVTASRY